MSRQSTVTRRAETRSGFGEPPQAASRARPEGDAPPGLRHPTGPTTLHLRQEQPPRRRRQPLRSAAAALRCRALSRSTSQLRCMSCRSFSLPARPGGRRGVAHRSGLGDRVPVAEAANVVADRPLADIDRHLGPAAGEDLGARPTWKGRIGSPRATGGTPIGAMRRALSAWARARTVGPAVLSTRSRAQGRNGRASLAVAYAATAGASGVGLGSDTTRQPQHASWMRRCPVRAAPEQPAETRQAPCP